MQYLNRLADAVLERILPQQEAGACVPENGKICACVNHIPSFYNCYGSCVQQPASYCAH